MQIVRDINNFSFSGEGILTIGTFDGVHFGHQKILKRLNELKSNATQKSIVFTFEPHPRKVLFPEQSDLQLLTVLNEKILWMESNGVDILILYPFTKEFAEIEPLDFITKILVEKLNVKKLVIGYDHKFGKDRRGDILTFRKEAVNYHFEVEEIPAQEINEINVSSTKIRKALFDGDVKTAAEFLGYYYSMMATVIDGKKLGRTIGFPTANLLVLGKSKLIPKIGVYLVRITIKNNQFFGMMNIGYNPTTDSDNKLKIEVNIFNFDKDIYNEELKIEFLEWIREEEKFNGLEELKNQIKLDEIKCKTLLQKLQY